MTRQTLGCVMPAQPKSFTYNGCKRPRTAFRVSSARERCMCQTGETIRLENNCIGHLTVSSTQLSLKGLSETKSSFTTEKDEMSEQIMVITARLYKELNCTYTVGELYGM